MPGLTGGKKKGCRGKGTQGKGGIYTQIRRYNTMHPSKRIRLCTGTKKRKYKSAAVLRAALKRAQKK